MSDPTADPITDEETPAAAPSDQPQPDQPDITEPAQEPIAPTTDLSLPQAPSLYHQSIHTLLHILWNDWQRHVRQTASEVLTTLNKTTTIFRSVVRLLEHDDPLKRVDALRYLGRVGCLLRRDLATFVGCFSDGFGSVRVEACKVCVLLIGILAPTWVVARCETCVSVDALLERLNDFEWKVRAYAIKALGLSQNTASKTREALRWAILHDSHPSVRGEAINASHSLHLIASPDPYIKDAIFTAFETDRNMNVRKLAEKVLIEHGLLSPLGTIIDTDSSPSPSLSKTQSTNSLAPTSSSSPSPTPQQHPNRMTRRISEQHLQLMESLVGERELGAVVGQVRELGGKERV
ncbi:HEAT repeat-containing protein 4, partial [Rhizophlyctis rosea]